MVKLLKKEASGTGLIEDLKKLPNRTNQKEKEEVKKRGQKK